MPFTVDGGGVALGLKELAQSHFIIMDAVSGIVIGGPHKPDAVGITAGQKGSSRGTADRLGYIKIRQPDAFGCHPIQVRCLEALSPITAHVGITLIIGEKEDDIERSVPEFLTWSEPVFL